MLFTGGLQRLCGFVAGSKGWCTLQYHRNYRLLQAFEQSKLQWMREQLMRRIDADLERKLAGGRRRRLQHVDRGAVAVDLPARTQRGAPGVVRLTAKRGQRRQLAAGLGQYALSDEFHVHVLGRESVERGGDSQVQHPLLP